MSGIDRESQELERAYPGILARLENEPLDRLARTYHISIGALYGARDRLRRLRQMDARPAEPRVNKFAPLPPPPEARPVSAVAAAPPAAPAAAPVPLIVKDPDLQASLEAAYPGLTQALARRDDVEVAIQYGLSLEALARIRELLGVVRLERGGVAPATAPRALPARLTASKD